MDALSRSVVPLSRLDPGDVAGAGGKGANLAALRRAGFPVPEGFVIRTEAYADAAERAHLAEIVERIAASSGGAGVAELARSARERLVAVDLPDDLRAAIRDAYASLGDRVPVAVRSSATAEDLPFASFAGQQDTFLGVSGVDAVLDAVRRCWASLWNDRAVAYRASNGIDERAVQLAVVVQRMVDAAMAGVLFTADPLTGRRRRAAIEAVPGLGDALVSGGANPDRYLVDVERGTVLERHGPGAARLDDERLRELAEIGARVEARFGEPQDIEWAIDRLNLLWLVQSRAITTLYPLPPNAPPSGDDVRVYFSANVAQGVYDPLTPMGLQSFQLFGSSVATRAGLPPRDPIAGPSIISIAGQRLFIDLTAVVRSREARPVLNAVLTNMEALSQAIVARLADDPRLSPRPTRRGPVLKALVEALLRTRLPFLVAGALLRPRAAADRVDQRMREVMALADTVPGAQAAELLDAYERSLLRGMGQLMPNAMSLAAAAMLAYGAAGRLLGPDATLDERRSLLRALPTSPTSQMNLSLWALAQQAKADPASASALRDRTAAALAEAHHGGRLPITLQRGLDEFLARYGHRGVAEIDLGVPRWSEDPTHILLVLQNYVRPGDLEAAPDVQFSRLAGEADAMVEELARRASRRGRVRGAATRFLLRRVRELAGYRETPKFYAVLLISRARALLLRAGGELAATGRVDRPADVFFLTLPEARAAVAGTDQRELVRRRRTEYERERRRRHVPRVLLSDGTEPRAEPAGTSGGLAGTPASAGTVSGVARVVRSPDGARLEPGQILVAPSTDPGWTPLFLTAGGLVMEMGGMMSHGAVVAREYGIPAVVGVDGATDRIASGSRITVDGSAGVVTLDVPLAAPD